MNQRYGYGPPPASRYNGLGRTHGLGGERAARYLAVQDQHERIMAELATARLLAEGGVRRNLSTVAMAVARRQIGMLLVRFGARLQGAATEHGQLRPAGTGE